MNIAVVIALLYILAVGLALCLAFAARRIRRSHPVAVGVFLLGSVLAALHADKPTPVPSALLRWDRGLADNGSIATNDTVFIRGTYDPLMANDALHVDYRDRTITDSPDGWARAYDGAVGDLADGFTVTIPDATNMVVWIWSEYVEPAPTHTNGEYRIIYVGRIDGGAADAPRYVTPRTPIKGEARCSARDYVQDGLIAMWDGIENAGWGIHDPNATTWIDLIGGLIASSIAPSQVGADFMLSDGIHRCYLPSLPSMEKFTIEMVVSDIKRKVSWFSVWAASNDNNSIGWPNPSSTTINWKYFSNRPGVSFDGGTLTALADGTTSGRLIVNGQSSSSSVSGSHLSWGTSSLQWSNPWGTNRGTLRNHCIRLYSRALTAEEIQHNHKIDSIRFGLPGAPSAVVPLSPPSLPPPAQSLFSTLATENLTE